MGYLFCYCIYKIKILPICDFWLMQLFPGPKSSIRREPSVGVFTNIVSILLKFLLLKPFNIQSCRCQRKKQKTQIYYTSSLLNSLVVVFNYMPYFVKKCPTLEAHKEMRSTNFHLKMAPHCKYL